MALAVAGESGLAHDVAAAWPGAGMGARAARGLMNDSRFRSFALALALAACQRAGATPVEMWRSSELPGNPPSTHSLMSPIVIPWTDDNRDGVIDEKDGGDVLFVGTNINVFGDGRLRLLEGRTGQDILVFDDSLFGWPSPWQACAAGDVDSDGFPEVVCGDGGNHPDTDLIMYNWDGTVRWVSRPPAPDYDDAPVSIALADLDGDGQSEILISRYIFDNTLTMRQALDIPPCRQAIPVDIDLDGVFEIVCGPNVARLDGTRVWSLGAGRIIVAPAQLDDDPFPEFVGTNWGTDTLRAWDTDGTLLWREDGPWESQVRSVAHAVADVNFDGYSEIFLGEGDGLGDGARRVVSYDHTGQLIWEAPSLDSGVGGGSIAWVSGGPAFLHEDEDLYVAFDARDGSDLFRLDNQTGTAWEAPVFADLDGDGIGEILTNSTSDALPGIRAWKDPSFCPARAVFNQHPYVPNYIGSDLRPSGPPATPIDWARVGLRQQRNDCPCPGAPSVDVIFSAGCTAGETCVRANVTPPRMPLSIEWTLPDGSTPRGAQACFAGAEGQLVRVSVSDGANCVVETMAPVPAPVARTLSVALVVPDCAAPETQCARAVMTGTLAPVDLAWTLPDGSPSAVDEPCFPVLADGTVSVIATDAAGCVASAGAPVSPYTTPVLVELSARGGAPLRVERSPGGVLVSWEASPSGLTMALFTGTIGTWWSHAATGCTLTPSFEDTGAEPAAYYLAGESGCGGEAGSLGSASTGAPRPQPPTGCP